MASPLEPGRSGALAGAVAQGGVSETDQDSVG